MSALSSIEFRRQVLVRILFAFAALVPAVVIAIPLLTLFDDRVHEWVNPALLGLFFAIPEALLQKSWKVLFLLGFIAALSCSVAFHGARAAGYSGFLIPKSAALVAAGAVVGWGAGKWGGLESRTLLCILVGAAGGIIAAFGWVWSGKIFSETPWLLIVMLLVEILPVHLAAGISVSLLRPACKRPVGGV
ncbi:MAG TPA: hypothetical protein VEJ63_20120 [Planctomycetota bacterium]|nr:hypothetical protein [Planctomycetota bacterium]